MVVVCRRPSKWNGESKGRWTVPPSHVILKGKIRIKTEIPRKFRGILYSLLAPSPFAANLRRIKNLVLTDTLDCGTEHPCRIPLN